MAPSLAALITLSFCAGMLWREQRLHRDASKALWLPFIWMFFNCSRFPGQWLVVLGLPAGVFGPSAEGTPTDAIVFLAITLLGVRVLSRRGFRLQDFVRDNQVITIFLLYCLLAVLWSDMPFVSFKRWIKILGHPVIALVILTDADAVTAIRIVLRRAAILLLPLSLLFIRYFPALGRSYDVWTGIPFISGVTTMKNSLGAVCFLYALFFCWDLLICWKLPDRKLRRKEMFVSSCFLGLAVYLLDISESATSLACFILGAAILVVLSTRFINPRQFIPTFLLILALAGIAEVLFDVRETVIHALGRNTTLTERTDLWDAVFRVPNSSLFGAGFEMFWTGERLAQIGRAIGWEPNQAHSGYIDTYLNLGAVGILLLASWIFAAFKGLQATLIRDRNLGRFGLAFLFSILAYNYTEAAFKAMHPVWTMFFLVSIRCDAFARRIASRARIKGAATKLPGHPVPELVGAT